MSRDVIALLALPMMKPSMMMPIATSAVVTAVSTAVSGWMSYPMPVVITTDQNHACEYWCENGTSIAKTSHGGSHIECAGLSPSESISYVAMIQYRHAIQCHSTMSTNSVHSRRTTLGLTVVYSSTRFLRLLSLYTRESLSSLNAVSFLPVAGSSRKNRSIGRLARKSTMKNVRR